MLRRLLIFVLLSSALVVQGAAFARALAVAPATPLEAALHCAGADLVAAEHGPAAPAHVHHDCMNCVVCGDSLAALAVVYVAQITTLESRPAPALTERDAVFGSNDSSARRPPPRAPPVFS